MNYFYEFYNDLSRNLNNIIRYSGTYCLKPESDSSHVTDMMAMCIHIADIVEEKYGEHLDKRELVYRCYIHDLDETPTGDINRAFKYHDDNLYKAINSATKDIMLKHYKPDFIKEIENAKDISNPYGLIIKVTDTLQSTLKIIEEVRLGNFHFRKVIIEHLGFLNELKDKLSDMIDCHENNYKDTLLSIIEDFYNEVELEVEKIKES